MQKFLNALLLRPDGTNGQDKPEPMHYAVAWGVSGFLISKLIK